MTELKGTATLTSSGDYSGCPKGNAVDGNPSTEWASASNGINSWITLTWASPVTIREIRLISRSDDRWPIPRFTFSDATYMDGAIELGLGDKTYVLLHPKTTTSLKISIAPGSLGSGENAGFKEIYISDAYTTPPTTNVTLADHITSSGSYNWSWLYLNAVDGGTSLEWASNGNGSGAYIEFEWLSAVLVESVQLRDRNGGERWGFPRFTFDDASYQDGGEVVGQGAFTTYTLTPKVTTSLRISIASGSSGSNIGLAEIVITGNVTPPSDEVLSWHMLPTAAMIVS